MFAYPRYQTQPMYAYSPEEYYYHSGSEASYHPHYEDGNRSNRYSKRRSSIKKPRRSKSFSKMDYNNYNDHHQRNRGDDEYYYQGQHRLDGVRSVSPFTENRDYHQARIHQDNEDADRRRNSWVQPTSFVNLGQPMINPMTNNYQMQQSLGACATDTWPGMTTNAYIPPHNDLFFPQQNVPMIQPYYMPPPLANNSNPFLTLASSSAAPTSYYPQQQAALFPNLMHMPMLFPELFSNNNTAVNNTSEVKEETTASKEVTPSASQKTSPIINTNQVPDAVTDTAPRGGPIKRPAVLHRKKSFMEGILSSFSLLGEDVNYAPTNSSLYPKPDDGTTDNLKSTTWDPTSYTSLREVLNTDNMTNHPPVEGERKVSSLSRKTSTRLLQKANALQTRQYIWCYRPYKQSQASPEMNNGDDSKESPGLWAAFDMRNQFKLDNQHYFLMSMKNRGVKTNGASDAKYHRPDIVTDDPRCILVLTKQSNISSPVMVSINDNVAWYSNSMQADFEVLEIACMPTHHNRLVVSNDLIKQEEEAALATKPLRRSKSMDGLASKLLNTVLGW